MSNAQNALTKSDFDQIERVIYKNSDDIAVSVARGLERLEERIDAAESHLFSRIAELEDHIRSLGK